MDCAKGAAVVGLCDDVMVDILSRVPVKDLRRSTCVSKPWRDLITHPLHRKKLPQTLEGFFHGGAGDHYGHFTSLSGRGESAPPVDPSFSFLTAKLPLVEHMTLLDSCNGLLLFGCTRENKFGYIVCNPATEELVTVPASSGSCLPFPGLTPLEERNGDVYDGDKCAHTYLMFDPVVSSHFHLVQFGQDNPMSEVKTVHSYSSETRAWSDTSNKWEAGEEHGGWGVTGLRGEAILELTRTWVNGLMIPVEAVLMFFRGRALVKGLLHFVAYHYGERENLIVAVDGEGTICRIICTPVKHGDAIAFIGQSQGHLHCIISEYSQEPQDFKFHFIQLSIWVLEDYDTQKWILKHNVSYSQLFESLSCSINNHDIVAIHPDHNSIIIVQHWNQKLVSYDMDSNELRALCTLGEGYRFITPYVAYFMESLVLATKD